MRRTAFWLRWTGRELRARWIQVAVIALIIAVGTGVYAGLGSTAAWRKQSNDESFARLNMYDLRVKLLEGSYVDRGRLAQIVGGIPSGDRISAAEERLIARTQVDASTAGRTVLVPGRIIGVDTSGGGPNVNGIHVTEGRSLTDDGAVLDAHFADHYELPASGTIRLSGGASLPYVGTGLAPEYFVVISEEGGFMAEANFAAVFTSLQTAQRATGAGDRVNDLVLTLSPGAAPDAVAREIQAAFRQELPGVGATVTGPEDEDAYRVLYDDIETDQQFWNLFAFIILAGAAFAAFNLTSRIVEAQRREIGIGMALGAPATKIALRPMLVGVEIALLGVLLGVGMGLLAALGLRSVFSELLPLPVWRTPLQPRVFLEGAVLGLVIPLLAAAWPVWRAIRVQPIEAIQTGHLAARGGGLAPLLKRLRLPGRSTGQIPVRNVLRAPRRTILTALGIAAAVTALIAILGMLDSFVAAVDRGEEMVLGDVPDRVSVDLDGFYPADAAPLTAIQQDPMVARAEPLIRVPGRLAPGPGALDASIELLDLEGMWRPVEDWRRPTADGPGILLAEKAADDLGVEIGDTIEVEHPLRTGGAAFTRATTPMEIIAIHPNPMRFVAYMSIADAGLMGLEGAANAAQVMPAPEAGVDDVKRALFETPGVASAQPVTATADVFRDLIDEFTGVLQFIVLFVLALAALIAFNAASISVEERAREHATMFAFGLRLRTLLRMLTVEGAIVGLAGTLLGLGIGAAVMRWSVLAMTEETVPDIGIPAAVSGATVLTAFAMGAAAVALAPLLTLRRLRRMDVPSTLRVME